jgi:hypothetical protein
MLEAASNYTRPEVSKVCSFFFDEAIKLQKEKLAGALLERKMYFENVLGQSFEKRMYLFKIMQK